MKSKRSSWQLHKHAHGEQCDQLGTEIYFFTFYEFLCVEFSRLRRQGKGAYLRFTNDEDQGDKVVDLLKDILRELERIQSDVSSIETDVSRLEAGVSNLEASVSNL